MSGSDAGSGGTLRAIITGAPSRVPARALSGKCGGALLAAVAAVALVVGASSCAKTERGRVMVLGIDGGTWRVLEPMMAAGQLPHIKKLYDEGLHGVLQSRPPILSPVVWTTIFTGVGYSTHGIKDWSTSQSTNRRVSAVWDIASKQHIRTDVFNVPGSWPAEPVDGVMVSGFPLSGSTFGGNTGEVIDSAEMQSGRLPLAYRDNIAEIRARVADLGQGKWTPWFPARVASRPGFKGVMRAMRLSPDEVYVTPLYRVDDGLVISEPPDVRAELSESLGEPYIPEGPGWSRWAEPETPAYLYQHLAQVSDIQTRAALQYVPGDWGLFIYVMTLVDRVSHPYWAYSSPEDFPTLDREKAKRYETAVADAYRVSDEALGRILDAAKGKFWVVVVSDHGFHSSADPSKAIGTHEADGIYMVWGPDIKPQHGERAHIEDVTPTLLYLLGLPVGKDMQGKPIPSVTVDLGRRVETVDTYERGGRNANDVPVDDSTWEQLRGLGYVDGASPRSKLKQQETREKHGGAGQRAKGGAGGATGQPDKAPPAR